MSFLKARTLKASEDRMCAWSKNLTARVKRFNHWVIIQHCDGTNYTFNGAFIVDDPEDKNYVWVFTEHQGYFAFAVEDLEGHVELQRVDRSLYNGALDVEEPTNKPTILFDDDEDTIPFIKLKELEIVENPEEYSEFRTLLCPRLSEQEKESILAQLNSTDHPDGDGSTT
jgi:hypothetical protein